MSDPLEDPDVRAQSKLIEELLDIDEGLTPWELDFIESIDKQNRAGRALSDKQCAIAERILERLR